MRVLENATLIILSAGTLYKWESNESKTTLLLVSLGIALLNSVSLFVKALF